MDCGDIKYLEVPAKITKLSEAIRIGIRKRPMQSTQCYYQGELASCALGAGYEGAGFNIHECDLYALTKAFSTPVEVMAEVADRNDKGHTREQIVDWLETEGY